MIIFHRTSLFCNFDMRENAIQNMHFNRTYIRISFAIVFCLLVFVQKDADRYRLMMDPIPGIQTGIQSDIHIVDLKTRLGKCAPFAVNPFEEQYKKTHPYKKNISRIKAKAIDDFIRETKYSPAKKQGKRPLQVNYNYRVSSKVFTIGFANDIFNNTDRYFTNGISIGLVHPGMGDLPFSGFLFPPGRGANVLYGIHLVHNMYTPLNPDLEEISFGDRPFSANLYIGFYKISTARQRHMRILSGFNIGVMGPMAMGSEMQNMIHDIEARGWQHQINNSLVANYYIEYESGFIESRNFNLGYLAGFHAGSLINKAGTGLFIQYRNSGPVPEKMNPPHKSQNSKINFSFYLKTRLDFIAHDANLQGSLFNRNSVYTLERDNLARLRFSAMSGITLRYRSIGLSLEQNYVSPEFDGALPHRWMQIRTSFEL